MDESGGAAILNIFERGSAAYDDRLATLVRRGDADLARVEDDVRAIVEAVRDGGDGALVALTERYEGRRPIAIITPRVDFASAADAVDPAVRAWLVEAANRIRAYHEHQLETGYLYEDGGIELGQRVRPLASVGVYAPGGKARYPSTVLMTAIPAQVAGVPRILLATPRPTPEILAAAAIAGVTEILDAGGAQAIAALAHGTESVRRVDKIVGPGNIYVAAAKRLVFGTVDIDQIAGPSEILVVADDGADAAVVAADLLSQAEHDEDAYPLLITLSRSMAERVASQLAAQLESLPRRAIAEASLKRHGDCFVVGDLDEAARVANGIAVEHLCLAVRDADALFAEIAAAGAVFLGYHTPEAAGDYAAGPSHVLPTGGAARFNSPLGVYDFVVRTSMIRYSEAALRAQAPLLQGLARLEGLEAHARAVAIRASTLPDPRAADESD